MISLIVGLRSNKLIQAIELGFIAEQKREIKNKKTTGDVYLKFSKKKKTSINVNNSVIITSGVSYKKKLLCTNQKGFFNFFFFNIRLVCITPIWKLLNDILTCYRLI